MGSKKEEEREREIGEEGKKEDERAKRWERGGGGWRFCSLDSDVVSKKNWEKVQSIVSLRSSLLSP